MNTLKELIAADKRKGDRLDLEIRVSYLFPDSQNWVGPVTIENISGGGLKFKHSFPLTQGSELTLNIDLLDKKKQIVCKGYVAWCKKDPSRNLYHIGVKLGKMNRLDRQRYVLHLCENILAQHLSPKGDIK